MTREVQTQTKFTLYFDIPEIKQAALFEARGLILRSDDR
jgi:hypothetical protein